MAHELWDREGANIIGEYDTEGEALSFIRRMVEAHGSDVVLPWALVYEDEMGATHSIATGLDLLHRARESAPA